MSCQLAAERVWTDKSLVNDAERKYYESFSTKVTSTSACIDFAWLCVCMCVMSADIKMLRPCENA